MATPHRHSRARRGATAARPAEEIIIRCGGRPVDLRPDDDGPVVSVVSLLRREGRGPHAAAGRLQPRTHLRAADVLPPPPPRRAFRKITVAASALFAIGAVVGPSVLNDAALPRAEAERPAQESGRSGAPSFRGAQDTPLAAMFLPAALQTVRIDDVVSGTGIEVRRTATRTLVSGPAGVYPAGVVPPAKPGPGEPTPSEPDPTEPGPTDPGSTDPRPTNPGPTNPGPTDPGPTGPDPTDPGPGGPGAPGPVVTVPLPGVQTPPVTLPPIDVPVVPGVPVTTPGIGVGPGKVVPPSVAVGVSGNGVTAATGPAKIVTPDVATTKSQVGPVKVGEAGVTLPDVGVSGGSVSVGKSGAKVDVPDVTVSKTEVRTPDLSVGDAEVPLPDVQVPEVSLTDVSDDPVEAVTETVTDTVSGADESASDLVEDTGETVDAVGDAVGDTVGGLLGGGTQSDDSDSSDDD